MTTDERTLVADLLRKQLKLVTEVSALRSLLDACETTNKVPRAWKQDHLELVQSRESQDAALQYEKLIAAFELSGDKEILSQWLQKLSESGQTN